MEWMNVYVDICARKRFPDLLMFISLEGGEYSNM